jgi:hypothetical protein
MIKVRELSRSASIADQIMWPLMFVLGGLKRDSVQETHFWHNQSIDRSEINSLLSVVVSGDDERAIVKTNRIFPFPMFHVPIFGGWRNYVVLQVQSDISYWHVGWIHRTCTSGSRLLETVQRLRIIEPRVKVLTQPIGFVTEYFAIGPLGEQLPLAVVDHGVLGDMKYPSIRLL